jgi:hypothetical protein
MYGRMWLTIASPLSYLQHCIDRLPDELINRRLLTGLVAAKTKLATTSELAVG